MAGHPGPVNGRSGAGRGTPAGGFTLVEILVVLAILATLISLVAVGIPMAMARKKKLMAQTLVNKAGAELLLLRNDQDSYGRYPPTRTKELKFGKTLVGKELGQANDVNVGIETLFFLLNNPEIRANQITTSEEEVGNTDEDNFRAVRGNAADASAKEYIDPWDQPLVYFHPNDYKDPRNLTTYKARDGRTFEAWPKRLPARLGGGFLNPNSCQLFSVGPNGEQDPDEAEEKDDIFFEGQ